MFFSLLMSCVLKYPNSELYDKQYKQKTSWKIYKIEINRTCPRGSVGQTREFMFEHSRSCTSNSSLRSVVYRWFLTFLSVACCSWMPSDYVDPCTPPSPSISLVHAYRDDELVSVPCNLLVQGDVVVLGPGHLAPAQVQQVNVDLSRFVYNKKTWIPARFLKAHAAENIARLVRV